MARSRFAAAVLCTALSLMRGAASSEPSCEGVCTSLRAEYERRAAVRPANTQEDGDDHTLTVTIDPEYALVTVDVMTLATNRFHPMSGTARAPPLDPAANHFIEAIYVVNDKDEVVAFSVLDPFTHTNSSFAFFLTAGSATLTPHAYCTVHGLFTGAPVPVPREVHPRPATVCRVACRTLPNVGDSMLSLYKQQEYSHPDRPRLFTYPVPGVALSAAFMDKHTPVLSRAGDAVRVTISTDPEGNPHPSVMSEDPDVVHYYSAIFIVDDNDVVVAHQLFAPSDTLASFEVRLPRALKTRSTSITAYAHCNKHGLFRSAPMRDFPVSEAAMEGVLGQCYPGCSAPGGYIVPGFDQTCIPTSSLAAYARHRQRARHGVNATHGRDPPDEEYTPVLTIAGDRAAVSIGVDTMPLIPTDRIIPLPKPTRIKDVDVIYAEDQDGEVLAAGRLDVFSPGPVLLMFPVPANTTAITPFFHDTQLGLFRGETTTLPEGVIEVNERVCLFSRCGTARAGESPLCPRDNVDLPPPDVSPEDTSSWPQSTFLTLHTPVLTADAQGRVTVTVGGGGASDELHPHVRGTTESKDHDAVHFIDKIWVLDQDDAVVAHASLSPDQPPVFTFAPPDGTSTLTPHASCTQHGMYTGTPLTVTYDITQDEPRTPELPQCFGEEYPTDICSIIVDKVRGMKDANGAVDAMHTPVVEFVNGTSEVLVSVGTPGSRHPMQGGVEGDVHFVDYVWAEGYDEAGALHNIAMWIPAPEMPEGADAYSVALTLPPWAVSLRVHVHCNLHGLFSTALLDITDEPARPRRYPDDACQVLSCFPSTKTTACNGYKAEITRADDVLHENGRNFSFSPLFVPGHDAQIKLTVLPADYETPTGVDARRVLVRGLLVSDDVRDIDFNNSPIRNTPLQYIESMYVEDQYEDVVALGFFSPTESFSTLEFEVPYGTTTLKPVAYVPSFGIVEGPEYKVATPTSAPRTAGQCVIAKCMTAACTSPYDTAILENKVYAVTEDRPPASAPETDDDDVLRTTIFVILLLMCGLFMFGCWFCCFKRTDIIPQQELDFIQQANMLEGEYDGRL